MNRTTTIVLVVLLAALGLYVLLVQNPKDKAAAEATPTADTTRRLVWPATADQVVRLRVSEPGAGRSVLLVKDAQGAWTVAEPGPAAPADPGAAQAAVAGAANLSVSSVVTASTDLAQFGVLSPTYTLELGLSDEQTLRAAVGSLAPVGGAYYVLREGEANVMVVPSFGIDSLTALLDAPPYLPTPTPTETAIVPGTPDGTPAPDPASATPTP